MYRFKYSCYRLNCNVKNIWLIVGRILGFSLNLILLVFYVTCNDISVIYVTAQMYRRTEEGVVPTVGLPTP